MYNPEDGSYTRYAIEKFPNQGLYRSESTFYIMYNAKKAIYAYKMLNKKHNGLLREKCEYYNIYLDLLFEATGLIINRFTYRTIKKTDNRYYQISDNRFEYGFNKESFPLLNDKDFRNFIEHIDEKDMMLIENKKYFGMFNLIYKGMNKKVKDDLLSDSKVQNNLLNLEDMTYSIIDSNDKGKTFKRKIIKLDELIKEIEKINKTSNIIWDYMNSYY